ncbi:MAG: DoxX family protein [Gammaproteobacteria bacterium]|nr:DoxX family protein [Gammaproteobacteria bacterium]
MNVCEIAKKFGPLAGRLLIANIFIISGYKKIGGFAGTAGYMASKMGLPQDSALVNALLVATIAIELGGGLLLLLGWQARWAATVMLLWMVPVTLIFHAYWGLPADQMQMQMIQFQKNMAIMGGLLYIIACGPGAFSLGHDKC